MEKIKSQYKAQHERHRVDHQFQVGYQVWLHINKERLKGEGKKLKPVHYGTFTILEKSGTNDFHLDLPPYMQIYSVVNVEKLKNFEPLMIMDHDEEVSIPSIDEFSPEYLDELKEDIILITIPPDQPQAGVRHSKATTHALTPVSNIPNHQGEPCYSR